MLWVIRIVNVLIGRICPLGGIFLQGVRRLLRIFAFSISKDRPAKTASASQLPVAPLSATPTTLAAPPTPAKMSTASTVATTRRGSRAVRGEDDMV